MAHITNKQGVASSMMKMSPEMMEGMMGSEMMGMGSDMMKGMMGSGMGNRAARETAKVVIVTGGSRARQGILGRLIRNPLVLVGLGFAAGYMIYEYRKDIVSEAKTE